MALFSPSEKAVPIRYPSTANLQLDSFDRNTADITPWAFSISRSNSILNGFFTRIATTEVVLEWNQANINNNLNNTTIDVSYNNNIYTVPYSQGFYTVASVLDEFVDAMNTLTSSTNWSVKTVGGVVGLDVSGGVFRVLPGVLQQQLGLGLVTTGFKPVNRPDLRPWRYLDFVSSQLTYNQDLKDSSTCPVVRDVLCRWYFAWDDPPVVDAYGFPILMGYTPFTARRIFNMPKQIRWDSIQPIGNLSFEVFGQNEFYPTGTPLASIYSTALSNIHTNWLMTLQVSEV